MILRVFVAGATGPIGSALVKELVAAAIRSSASPDRMSKRRRSPPPAPKSTWIDGRSRQPEGKAPRA